MRSLHAFTLGAVAFVTLASGSALAQEPPSPILNAVEVQRLVARSEAGDHARLGAHFDALADMYAVEAKRHTSMAQRYAGNPSRDVTSLGAHCRRLADLNAESASAVRDLAAHHKRLGAGEPSDVSKGDTRFDAGQGARAPNAQELGVLAATARTQADHEALAQYFLTLAKRYGTDVDNHAALARAYRSPRTGGSATAAAHCERLATLSRDAANEANTAATMHRNLAGAGR